MRFGILVFCFFLGTISPLFAIYSGGSGTFDDPYQIADANDILMLRSRSADRDRHFIQTSDIDLSGNTFPGPVVDTFAGRYDGMTHVIYSLVITTVR